MGKKKSRTMAEKADKYVLYQDTVQAPDFEIEFCSDAFRKEFNRRAITFREDFCGTASFCCAWVKSHAKRRAIGIDLDPEPLEWGKSNNLAKLKRKQRERIQLIQGNVLDAGSEKVDVVGAQNFSYFIFHERKVLLQYFMAVHDSLADEGVFVIDVMGGPNSQLEQEDDPREYDGYTYIWEHHTFNPIDHLTVCKIHFEFDDGSEMRDAFTYPWRLWTIPELRELLDEAGFNRTDVYWEGTDEKTGEGDGEYTCTKIADAAEAWVAYIAAIKK